DVEKVLVLLLVAHDRLEHAGDPDATVDQLDRQRTGHTKSVALDQIFHEVIDDRHERSPYCARLISSPTWTSAVPPRVAVADASSVSVTFAVPTLSTMVRRTFFVCGSRI